jgi:hypothetical protein
MLMLWSSRSASASCVPPEPPLQNLQHSDAVFSGQVVSIGSSNILNELFGWGYPVTFNVLESWKGVTQTTVVLEGQSRTSTEFPFQQGQRYLVYAYHEGNNGAGSLTTNGCKGTKLLHDAHDDVLELGPPAITLQPAVDGTPRWLLPFVMSITMLLTLGIVVVVRRRRRLV